MGHLPEPPAYSVGGNASYQPVAAGEVRSSRPLRDCSRSLITECGRYDDDFTTDGTESVLIALAEAVEQRDTETAGHCERLTFSSVAIGVAMGLERTELVALYRGGYLHDLGKVGIPDAILFKPGPLTTDEWVTMRSHTVRGEEICRHLPSLQPVLPIIRHHHERWDGGGYPDHLSGNKIPKLARIVQVADIYDALISPRPYKLPMQPHEALHILREETNRGWRDPEIVSLFFGMHQGVISKIGDFAAGTDRNLEAMRNVLANLQ